MSVQRDMLSPPNILASLIALRHEINETQKNKAITKDDVIDIVNQRCTVMLKSFITQPFQTSFFFPIKAPAESDQFDRLALRMLEERS